MLSRRLCSNSVTSLMTLCTRQLHEDKYISVRDFYRNKNVFITGCTGFLGQGLVEKLLRSCPDVGNIYLPIRTTKKGDTTQRYQKFLNNSVFDNLRSADSNFATKLVPLAVVLEEPNLGLPDDVFERLVNDVSVIFHLAALIKFNPALREAIRSNVLVSTNVFRFGKKCKSLQAYVYVSSLYTHIDRDLVEEKVYPTTWNHDQLIELCDDKNELRRKQKAIVGSCSGTYFATKKIAENLTKLENGSCPVAIFRPGKVSPSIQHPEPGWSHGYASYIPWMFMVEKGEVRHHMGVPDHKEELIPVDLCANSLLSTAWYIGTRPNRTRYASDPFVVHINSSQDNYLTTPDVVAMVNKYLQDEGRSYKVILSSSKLWLIMAVAVRTVFQTTSAFLKGEKPLSLLLYLFVFTDKGINAIQLKNNPKEYKNFDKIEKALSISDKRDFSSDVSDLNWEEYIRTWLRALKTKRESRENRVLQSAQHVQTLQTTK